MEVMCLSGWNCWNNFIMHPFMCLPFNILLMKIVMGYLGHINGICGSYFLSWLQYIGRYRVFGNSPPSRIPIIIQCTPNLENDREL